uniref:Mitochondrial carrier protein n=1 Tax=Ditylum brightwellii TaxID=49249 RepID=A0A7S4VS12_9STRA
MVQQENPYNQKNNNTEVKKKVQRNNNMEVKKKVQSNNTEVKKRVTSQKVATKKETTPLKKDDTRTASTLSSSDIQQIIAENAINVTEVRTDKVLKRKTLLTIDKNYEIVQTQDVPSWVPKAVVRPPRVIKVIPNSELLFSSIFAGSITEIIRTSLLYPLGTIRNRIQADRGQSGNMNFGEKAYDIFTSFAVQAQKGDLYAGIIPSLLVTVPASGFYYGARDVTKRMLQSTATTSTPLDDVAIALGAAFVADVVSLAIRTPVDVLATRLQVQGSESNVGNWFKESLERLPALILTDLPFLFTKIALNKAITYSGEDLGRYEIQTILIACFCAFLTTPFDVARTRIVMEIEASNNPFANITELAPVEGVLTTMKRVTKEGDGGVPNLFAGWVQRTLYLGIGRAWFDPIRVIGYLGIRDAVLLEWFK